MLRSPERLFKMKKRNIISFILSMCLCSTFIPSVSASTNVNMTINENKVIRTVDRNMFGINCEWSAGEESADNWLSKDENGKYIINPQFGEVWKDTMVSSRQAGASSQDFLWKNAIGPMESRPNQKMWGYQNGPIYGGLVEWLKAQYEATPDAEVIYTFNLLTDSIENIADIVEFMVGDGTVNYNGGENWAQVRKDLGIEEPVKVFAWELGNELDWANSWSTEQYLEVCKKVIPVVKSIDKDAKITAFVNTAAHSNGTGRDGTSWENWHRPILEELGDQIDYLAFHYYYPSNYIRRADVVLERIEDDIIDITGSDRIKIIVSEVASAPNSYTFDKNNPYDYNLPHTIWGATANAEYYLRTMLRPSVVATYNHSINSSVWCIVYTDANGNLCRTAVGDVINTFVRFGTGELLDFNLDTYGIDKSSNIAAAPVRDKDGNINIIFTNRYESDPVTVNFKFENGNYRVKKVRKIHGDVKNADRWYRPGSQWECSFPEVETTEEDISDESPLVSYTFDPLSVYALALEPTGQQITQENLSQSEALKFMAVGKDWDKVYLNGRTVSVSEDFGNAKAFINQEGSMVIPSEMLKGLFGAELTWNDSGTVCDAKIGNVSAVFDISNATVTENGAQSDKLVPAHRYGEWTYFGLRNIADNLSYNVTWDDRGFALIGKTAPSAAAADYIYNTVIGG